MQLPLWYGLRIRRRLKMHHNVIECYTQINRVQSSYPQQSIIIQPGCIKLWKSWTRLSDFTFTFHFHTLEKEMVNPLLCSCLENPRDGGAWSAAVYGVAQSRTRLKRLSGSSSMEARYKKGRKKEKKKKERKKRESNNVNYAGNSAPCSFQGVHTLVCAWDRKWWSMVLPVNLSSANACHSV